MTDIQTLSYTRGKSTSKQKFTKFLQKTFRFFVKLYQIMILMELYFKIVTIFAKCTFLKKKSINPHSIFLQFQPVGPYLSNPAF